MASGDFPNFNGSNNPAPGDTGNQAASIWTADSQNCDFRSAITPAGDIVITERSLLPEPTWPADLTLDRRRSNWQEWSRRLSFATDRQGFTDWLDGSIPCPDPTTHPRACQIWRSNDRALRAFIFERISHLDYYVVRNLADSHSVYEKLRERHERLGPYVQVLLIKEALEMRHTPGASLSDTINAINCLHTKIVKIGDMDNDKLLTVLLLNALGRHYAHLQSTIHWRLNEPYFSSEDAVRLIEAEESLQVRQARKGLLPNPSDPSALAANTKDNDRNNVICSNCKRNNHHTEFCVLPGGEMAGKSIEEARAAQRTAAGKPPHGNRNQTIPVTNNTQLAQSPAPTTMSAPSFGTVIMFNGRPYTLVPDTATR